MNQEFAMIPLAIETSGKIITNNLPEFRDWVRAALGKINRNLTTDEEFGQAEKDIKVLKESEEAVRAAAVKSFDKQLKALVESLNETAEEIRVPRLELEKLVAKRKEDVRSEIVEEFLAKFDIDPDHARRHFLESLKTQIKGKRTVESMRTACRVYQTTQQAMILKSRDSIDKFVKKFGPDLVMDRRELELKNVESVQAELVRRYDAKQAEDTKKSLQKQVDDAKAETEKVKIEAAESGKPPAAPANVEQGPWSGTGNSSAPIPTQATAASQPQVSQEAEWGAFKGLCLDAFKELKPIRENLRHPDNVAKAQAFADALNAAWQAANRKEAV